VLQSQCHSDQGTQGQKNRKHYGYPQDLLTTMPYGYGYLSCNATRELVCARVTLGPPLSQQSALINPNPLHSSLDTALIPCLSRHRMVYLVEDSSNLIFEASEEDGLTSHSRLLFFHSCTEHPSLIILAFPLILSFKQTPHSLLHMNAMCIFECKLKEYETALISLYPATMDG